MTDKEKLDYLLDLIFSPERMYLGAAKLSVEINGVEYMHPLQSAKIWESDNEIKSIEIEIFFQGKSILKEGYNEIEKIDIDVMLNLMEGIMQKIVLHGYSNLHTSPTS